MKKSIVVVFLLTALVLCMVQPVFADDGVRIYLGESVAVGASGDVRQPIHMVSEGASSVKYAFEEPRNNKFVRLANFDGAFTCGFTGFAVRCDAPQVKSVSVSIDYRLFEGDSNYSSDDVVLTIGYRGGESSFSYGQLSTNVLGDYSWKNVSFQIDLDETLTSDFVTVEYRFGNGGVYSSGRACLDIDNVTVEVSGVNYCASGSFQDANVSAADTLDTDYSLNPEVVAQKKSLMLSSENIAYRVNSEYDDAMLLNFNTYTNACTLSAGKSDGLYTDTASGAQFVVYDAASQNTFIRMGKFNATKDKPLVRMCFADNDLDAVGNLPKTTNIYISFKYRLYIDEDILAQMNNDDYVFELSTRKSSLNNSGRFTLDNMVVNQQGDDTWQQLSCVLQTNLSSTAFMEMIFYTSAPSSYFTQTYLDIDSLYVGVEPNGKNYAYKNGEWEGLVNTTSQGVTPMNPPLTFHDHYGERAIVSTVDSTNCNMLLAPQATFSVAVNQTVTSNVYDIDFDLDAQSGDKLEMMFGGRSGKRLILTAGQNVADDNCVVTWQAAASGYKCFVSFVKYDTEPLSEVDFVNVGTSDIAVDNVFVGQVKSVDATAGDYDAFTVRLAQFKTQIAAANYNNASAKLINNAVVMAERLTRFASQQRMDDALAAIDNAMSSGVLKADLTALRQTLARSAEIIMGGKSYTKATKSQFMESYFAAKNLTEQNSQAEVDAANETLNYAIDHLVEYNVAAAVVSGTTVLAAAAVVFKKLKETWR